MNVENLPLEGLKILKPKVFEDERGYFFESFNKSVLSSIGIDVDFVQDNQAYSRRGVLRGLHLQTGKFSQAKLCRVVKGEVLDVAVDVRVNSKTFGKYVAVILSESNQKQIYIPKGYAHGYVSLSEHTIFHYKCDNYYNKDSERSIKYNDKDLAIDWGVPESQLIVSEKDLNSLSLKELKVNS